MTDLPLQDWDEELSSNKNDQALFSVKWDDNTMYMFNLIHDMTDKLI